MNTPQDFEKIQQFLATQRSSGQLRGGDFGTGPRMTAATPEAEQAEYRPQMMTPQDAARLRGLPRPNFDGFDLSRLSEAGSINPDGTRFVPDNTRYGGVNPDGTNYVPDNPRYGGVNPDNINYPGGSPNFYGINYAGGDSGTGPRTMDYRPSPQPAPVYTPPPVNVPRTMEYRPSPQPAPVYTPPRQSSPVNTAYMPSRQPAPIYRPSPQPAQLYRSPFQAAPTYGSPFQAAPTYGSPPQPAPTYGVANAPTYGGQPSYSPKQAGKYGVGSPQLRNTGGRFNDMNAFFGRSQI